MKDIARINELKDFANNSGEDSADTVVTVLNWLTEKDEDKIETLLLDLFPSEEEELVEAGLIQPSFEDTEDDDFEPEDEPEDIEEEEED